MNKKLAVIISIFFLHLPATGAMAENKNNKMQELVQKSKDSPKTLSDNELSRVFVHLMEHPQDTYGSSDLVQELRNREESGDYVITRALALYYSNLNGDLFYVREGDDYNQKLIRAVTYYDKAFKKRNKGYDERLRKYGEFEDSYLERDLAFGFKNLLEEVYDIREALKLEFSESHVLFKKSDEFVAIEKKIDQLDSALEVMGIIHLVPSNYANFLKESFKALPNQED